MRNKWKYPSHHSELNQLRFKEKQMDYVLNTVQADPCPDMTNPKKKIIFKRLSYLTTAAAALFMLIIGSTHFSLDMAKAAAKIPYFSLFIKQEEYKYALYDSIQNVINEHQYQVVDLDVSIPKKKITVSLLGSKAEVKTIKADVIANINEELVSQDFGKYKILVKKGERPDPGPELTQEEEKYITDSVELEKKILHLLAQHNYTPAFPIEARINSMENFIYIALPNTESKQRVTELKELLNTVTKDYGEFRMRITSIDMKAREQELRWGNNIIGILAQGLMSNKSFQVTGFSYSFHPYPLQIKVKTSVQSTDPKAKELAEEMINEMKVFIQTHELTKDVRNDEYKVIIYGKDKEIILEE
ncbi:DUF4030 domain-containing protein [Niallia endozanthoxylica]|uniref:DUF4030 domain-containing protein n=1 Tax=Niallia endozanthoxylica TaxID=2036016 RepID=A0A5J5HNG9_9BACI|nr:DUF4030 domain-containing protein [Niallia endozanthoxylica]KAA9022043.1 DUF4030 domain-containing protein [Niallia endozanthoxylica]